MSPGLDLVQEQPAAGRRFVQLLCALALVLPMAAIAYWMQGSQESTLTPRVFFLGPLVGGGALCFWILFLHVGVCRDRIDALGFRPSRVRTDFLLGIGLAALGLVVHFSLTPLLTRAFPPRPPAPQVLELIGAVAADPVLLALWLGPVVWLGIALFEEMARTFLLRRLWLVWQGPTGAWVGIVSVSMLVGMAHWYQGPAAMLVLSFKSVWLGWVFLKTRRILALVVSHALYDSVQIALAVVMTRGSGG